MGIVWPDFRFPPINLYVMPPTKLMYDILMEKYMSDGISDMFDDEYRKAEAESIIKDYIKAIHEREDHIKSKKSSKEYRTKLISDHWSYIKKVLEVGGRLEAEIDEIGFHYKTAMEHGWKHAEEYHGIDPN